MDVLGRKRSLLLSLLILLIGWIMIATAGGLITVCIGRFTCGCGASAVALIAPIYVAEISGNEWRGCLGSLLSLFLALGITYVISVGALVQNWQLTTVACIIPLVLGFVSMLFVPESPYHLAWKMKDEKAALASLHWLHAGQSEKIELALSDIRKYLEQNEPVETTKTSVKEQQGSESQDNEFTSSLLNKIRLIVLLCVVMMLSRFTGVPALCYYMVEVFQRSSLTFDAHWAAVIVTIIEVIGMVVSLFLADRVGRKALLLSSGLGVSISLAMLGWDFHHKDSPSFLELPEAAKFIPLVAMLLFFLMFSIGYGPVPFVLLGELFPPGIKAVATSISIACFWIFDFVVAKLYFWAAEHIGNDGVMFLLMAVSLAGVVFVSLFVPETRNKTLAQIQSDRRKSSACSFV